MMQVLLRRQRKPLIIICRVQLVYGIGNSTEAIYYLDSGWTEALITPDEFAAGYKSVVGLVDMLRGSRKYSVEEKPVSYQLLTRKKSV